MSFEPSDDPDADPSAVAEIAAMHHPLAKYAKLLLALPVVAIIGFSCAHHRQEVREVAVKLCAVPPPCADDSVTVAFAYASRRWRLEPDQKRPVNSLVVYQRSPDCSRDVEIYYWYSGELMFRGSTDDPDLAARQKFIEQRERWHREHRIVSTEPCDRAEHL